MVYSKDLSGVLVPQYLCATKRSLLLSLLYVDLLQSSEIAATLLKSILQSTNEESIKNIILVYCERSLLALLE